MVDLFKPLGLAVLVAMASPAVAQDATATEGDAAATTEAPVTPTGTELDMGTDAMAPAQPAQPTTYVDETFGDWQRECLRLPEGQEGDDPCQITQILREAPEANPIGKISMGRLPEGQQAVAGSMIIMPLGTLLTQQITLGVDATTAKRYPFRFCDQIGCVAQIGFTAGELQGFKAGNQATITISPAAKPDAKVAVPVSLKGFTAAWDSLAPNPGN